MTENPNTETLKTLGRVEISGSIIAATGLYIGGNDMGIGIGGVDSVVVRNSLTSEPYVPGSSLKGKMRCLLERALALPLEVSIGGKNRSQEKRIHFCISQDDYDKCPVCNVFGISSGGHGGKEIINHPTRLIVRDAPMNPETRRRLEENTQTDMPLTEVKTEVVIDRLTSAATPRQRERVPAGSRFDLSLVYTIYRKEDFQWLPLLFCGMGLLESDYLGGQGSRGYGQVKFENIKITCWPEDVRPSLPAPLSAQTEFPAITDVWKELWKNFDQKG
ncbi:MAG TPA: type III-A CRISPR-associated RAMP protein Csm3 [Candidatus Sumerlaeota bacterium]|nr:type III-A CRISPR-associated RAMP protein Csm3 [Candidatus Sumerlaeota bacterium]